MARPSKVKDIVGLLERRIQFGDYTIRKLPTEMGLAEEIGVDRLTARKAMLKLIESGVLVRQPNGRILVNRSVGDGKRQLVIGILSPAWVSTVTLRYRIAIETIAQDRGCSVRSMEYRHWEDIIFSEALNECDGLFIHPSADHVQPGLIRRLKESGRPVVMMDRDLSSHGIVSFDTCPPSSFVQILDHLKSLGHKRIDCFNTQPFDEVIFQRVEQWSLWRAANNIDGRLINRPVNSFSDHVTEAYKFTHELLADRAFDSAALFCTTSSSAQAVLRALYDVSEKAVRSVAVAGADDADGTAWLSRPSLTALRPPDPAPYLSAFLEWISTGGEWQGPLLVVPKKVDLVVGESTSNATAP